jgi:hypothetical protein
VTGAAKGSIRGGHGSLDPGLLSALEHWQDAKYVWQRRSYNLPVVIGVQRLANPNELRTLLDFDFEFRELEPIDCFREDATRPFLQLWQEACQPGDIARVLFGGPAHRRHQRVSIDHV